MSKVSLRPSEMVQGGLIDDVDVTITAAVFLLYDFNGKAPKPRVCAKLDLTDDDGNIHEQYLSAADPEHFVPDDTGNELVATGDKKNMNRGTNFEGFFSSMVNAGFPEPNIDNGLKALVGCKIHVVRQPAPKRSGIITEEGGREKTVLVCSKLISMPGEAAAKKTAAAGGAKTAAKTAPAAAKASAAPAAGGDDSTLQALVVKAIEAGGGSAEVKKAVVPFVFRNATGDPASKKAATKRVVEDTFLESGMEAGLWLFDATDGTVTAI